MMTNVAVACLSLMAVLLPQADGMRPSTQPGAGVWQEREGGRVMLKAFATAPYPHVSREQGWTNRAGRVFAAEHYQDSTVGIFVPGGYRKTEMLDVVVHFHGHGSNVAKNLDDFLLLKQFADSGVNAVLIMPQGPKDVPDSGCGKLELEQGAFRALLEDVRGYLVSEGITDSSSIGKIVITSFSGGYKVTAAVLELGGIEHDGQLPEITDVLLLDSSYGGLERLANFAKASSGSRLVSFYTEHLKDENEELRKLLMERGARVRELAEPITDDNLLSGQGVVLIPTALTHYNVPMASRYTQRLLQTSSLEKR